MVSTEWLAERLSDVCILDVRGKESKTYRILYALINRACHDRNSSQC